MHQDRLGALHDRLTRFDAAQWHHAVDSMAAEIHPVDRTATRIWFSFFPLELCIELERAGDPAQVARQLGLMGEWRLSAQVDQSHRFLYGHRYWPQVKAAIGETDPVEFLPVLIRSVAAEAARTAGAGVDLLLGISAAGLMTLRQAGTGAFAAAPGHVHLSPEAVRRSPAQVLARRARDNWQGPLGFLRGISRRWEITFDEGDDDASFTAIHDQDLATAAQSDKREYRSRDARCIPDEGPIPVECRAASCGTCWVGVLGGAEKLSPISDRDEGRRLRVFGYTDARDPQSVIRLACQSRTTGAASIVIPPWNGFIGSLTKPRPHP